MPCPSHRGHTSVPRLQLCTSHVLDAISACALPWHSLVAQELLQSGTTWNQPQHGAAGAPSPQQEQQLGCHHGVLGCGRSCLSLGGTGACSTCLGEIEKGLREWQVPYGAAIEVNGPEAAGSGGETTQSPLNSDSAI